MTTDELKAALVALAKDEPEFFAELIGNVVKENLVIAEQQRDYYASRNSHVNPELRWGQREKYAFSYA